MKRIIVVLMISLLVSSLLFSSSFTQDEKEEIKAMIAEYDNEKEDISYRWHISLDTAMIHGYPTLGAISEYGAHFDTVAISFYLRYEHFFKPLGSATGKLAVAEEYGECGMSMKIRIYEIGRFNVNIGMNTAWYQQWLMLNSNKGVYNLTHNGLLIRPEASIGWRVFGEWNAELGFYYQTPLYPSYDGYQGWGCFLKIL